MLDRETTFTCAACGGTFDKARDDNEALADSELLWGKLQQDERIVVCEECFNRGIMDALADFHGGKIPVRN